MGSLPSLNLSHVFQSGCRLLSVIFPEDFCFNFINFMKRLFIKIFHEIWKSFQYPRALVSIFNPGYNSVVIVMSCEFFGCD